MSKRAEALAQEEAMIAIAECYQPLFELMSNEHDKILLISEMDDIISACEKVKENFKNNL